MLGIGGGIIFVPLLYLLLPYADIDLAQITYIVIATSIFAAMFGTLSSARKHFYSKNIDMRKALLLGCGSFASSLVAPFFAVQISPFILKIIFAVIFLGVAVKILFEMNGNFPALKKPLNDFLLIVFGLFIGLLPGFAGIGGGILFVPLLVYLFLVDFKKAIGTSSMVMVFTTVTTSIAYAIITPKGTAAPGQIGYVYLLAGIPLGLGSALGALNGAKFVMKTQTLTIKKIFSALLIIIALKIIFNL